MDYINSNMKSLVVQDVTIRTSKVYGQTIVTKRNKNKLADVHTNKRARPPRII